MGVAAVWDLIKPGCGERIPFSVLASVFYEENERPLRIAVDAYQWIFECRGANLTSRLTDMDIGKFIGNFLAKIRYLLKYNISFVLVFDGSLKPTYKRDKSLQSSSKMSLDNRDYDIDYDNYQDLIRKGDYREYDAPDLVLLKKILKIWNISYIEAPGEGEAEAARLQKTGVVDFVLSNDSDVLIYGATNILRNFSKFTDDKPSSSIGGQTSTDQWCTPVNMYDVEAKTGYNQKRLMLFSILCGADYNEGVTTLGPIKSSQIALSGSSFIRAHIATFDYKDLDDYSELLYDIYSNSSSTKERKEQLKIFQSNLLRSLQTNSVAFFKRNYQITLDGFPPEYVISQYHKPLVTRRHFAFSINDTNFAEFEEGQHFLKNVNLSEIYSILQALTIQNVKNVGSWFSSRMTEAYVLKSIITNLNEYSVVLERLVERSIIREKNSSISSNNLYKHSYFSARYQIIYNFRAPINPLTGIEPPGSPRKKNGELLWVPKGLVPLNSKAYREYEVKQEDSSKKISPRKSSQINNLGKYIPSLSPAKTISSLITKPSPRKKNKSILEKNISPEKRIDIFTAIKNSPKKKLNPLTQIQLNESDSDEDLSPLESPTENKVIGITSSPILLDSEDDAIITKSDAEMKDVNTARRKLDFSNINSEISDNISCSSTDDILNGLLKPRVKPDTTSILDDLQEDNFWTERLDATEEVTPILPVRATQLDSKFQNIFARKLTYTKSPFTSYNSKDSGQLTPRRRSTQNTLQRLLESPTLESSPSKASPVRPRNMSLLEGVDFTDDEGNNSNTSIPSTKSSQIIDIMSFNEDGKLVRKTIDLSQPRELPTPSPPNTTSNITIRRFIKPAYPLAFSKKTTEKDEREINEEIINLDSDSDSA